MNEKFCQSCGMPMESNKELYGKNADGSLSEDYCSYCYDNGSFVAECSMDEMIHSCIPFMVSANPDMSEDGARTMMLNFFPSLKRWSGN